MDIAHQLMRLSSRMVEVHSVPKDFDCGVLLYPAEVHTLEVIEQNPTLNMTELAALLHVTRGAVSQMVSRLEKKGLLEKRFTPGSEKQRQLAVTSSGKKACRGHQQYHRHMVEVIDEKMADVSLEELKNYMKINKLVEALIEELR